MADPSDVERSEVGRGDVPADPTAGSTGTAVGWTVFGGTMIVLTGVWSVTAGLIGVLDEGFYTTGQEWTYRLSVTTWSWLHIGLGVLLVAAGSALFSGARWARVVGVVLASFVMLTGFAWLPYYPLWGVFITITAGAVVWALTVHGEEVAQELVEAKERSVREQSRP